jgi:2-polyprenyl-6-methoxyphenol hydroxylase-like FAD-dependent oxidoreductase
VLLDRLNELGGNVLRPKRLMGLTQDAHDVTATFDDGDTIRARYVVGADGMHSTVRERAHVGFRGQEYAESFVLADVRLHGGMPVDEILLFYAREGLAVGCAVALGHSPNRGARRARAAATHARVRSAPAGHPRLRPRTVGCLRCDLGVAISHSSPRGRFLSGRSPASGR